jgi:RNA polymerase sigma factor (sigma-70 family)
MEDVLSGASSNDRISDIFRRERGRLRNFVRKRVPDEGEAEDILQDVFYELIEAYRLTKPVDQVGAWLFQVARNRIIDLFRKKRPVPLEDGDLNIDQLLPSPDAGPEAAYARSLLWDEVEAALDELPKEQRDAFIAHEIDGRSFKDLAAETGVSVNTLLSRKRYAVLHLRERLREIHDEILGEVSK